MWQRKYIPGCIRDERHWQKHNEWMPKFASWATQELLYCKAMFISNISYGIYVGAGESDNITSTATTNLLTPFNVLTIQATCVPRTKRMPVENASFCCFTERWNFLIPFCTWIFYLHIDYRHYPTPRRHLMPVYILIRSFGVGWARFEYIRNELNSTRHVLCKWGLQFERFQTI